MHIMHPNELLDVMKIINYPLLQCTLSPNVSYKSTPYLSEPLFIKCEIHKSFEWKYSKIKQKKNNKKKKHEGRTVLTVML